MARPKGSKNIPKTGNNVQVLNFSKDIEGTPITKNSNQGWVNWGIDNLYPLKLLNLYSESPTHAAAINFGVQSIVMGGIDYEKSNFDGNLITPNAYYSWGELMRNIAKDYMLYGSYAVQIILNKDRKTYSFYHIDLSKVRWSEYDEDGQITSFWISNDWRNTGMNPPIEIDAFDMRPDTKIEYGKPYLYVFRPYSPTMDYYTMPHYAPALKSIMAEIAYINYDIKHIKNGFQAAGALVLGDLDSDDEKRAVIKNINNMFVGEENSNSIAIAFRRTPDEKPIEWVPFTDKSTNPNMYAEANERVQQRILSAHQINDPQLIGLPNLGGTGFNSEGQLLETAFNVYNIVVGNYNRECVIKTFNFMLQMQGLDTEIVMKPLSFILGDKQEQSSTDARGNDEIDDKDLTEDKIEEKVEN